MYCMKFVYMFLFFKTLVKMALPMALLTSIPLRRYIMYSFFHSKNFFLLVFDTGIIDTPKIVSMKVPFIICI